MNGPQTVNSEAAYLPLRVGAGLSQPPSVEEHSFYQWLCLQVGSHLPMAGVSFRSPPSATCFTLEELDRDSRGPANAFLSFLEICIGNPPLILLVHLKAESDTIVPTGAERILLNEVRLAALGEHFGNTLFVVLRSELPPPGDALGRLIRDVVAEHRVVVVGESGNQWNALETEKPEPAEVRLRLSHLKFEAIERIRRRLVRVRGHFRRTIGGEEVCTKFFFDASNCVPDVVDHVVQEFADELEYTDRIVFDAEVSSWLEDIAVLLGDRTGLPIFSLSRSGFKLLEVGKTRCSDLLLLPVVDSGNTLKSILEHYKQRAGALPGWAVAIVGTGGVKTAKGWIRPGFGLDLSILAPVERGLQRRDDCPYCSRLGSDPVPLPFASPSRLSSLAFWDMVRDIGFKDEQDVPPWRAALPEVPDIPGILEKEDGPWLSRLLLERLTSEAGRDIESCLLIVAPDQSGARMLVSRISDLAPSTQAVHIPEETIRRFERDPAAQLEESEKSSPWATSLRQASAWSTPVICEEFSVSGGTAIGLVRLLKVFNKNPRVHLVTVDFGGRRQPPDAISDLRKVAVYEIETWRVPGYFDPSPALHEERAIPS